MLGIPRINPLAILLGALRLEDLNNLPDDILSRAVGLDAVLALVEQPDESIIGMILWIDCELVQRIVDRLWRCSLLSCREARKRKERCDV